MTRARKLPAADTPKRPKVSAFAEIAARSKSFKPPREVLRRVRAVPTIFPAIDYKLRVGGWPIDRVAFIRGPSGEGKTHLMHGLGLSFLKREHCYFPMDAEHTTPHPWLETLMGKYADDPRFYASRPDSYEQAVDDVRKMALALAELRDAGRVPPDTTALFGVDSIGKLVPQNILEKIKRHAAESGDGSVDGYKGAAGMIKAAMNKAWLDQLIPQMSKTGCAMVFIVRESLGKDGKEHATGGVSILYEASLDVRVSKAIALHEGTGEEAWKTPVVGEKHLIEIHKTKVSAREARVERTYFHTSKGLWTPEGFDRARDLLELGQELGIVVKGAGGWIRYSGNRWQGDRRFLVAVSESDRHAKLLDEIEEQCRGKFAEDLEKNKPEIVGA